ncbi:MAG: amidohydrolase [Alphaproteobacteria bacterium]|nr:amidohydrolase [Alphaproteobacteria bacterium]
MPTIDAQVHCYERNHPGRPWHAVLAGPPQVTAEDMIKAMDSVGVDGAILVSVYTMYRWDASYAVDVQKKHPGKFGVVKPVNANDPQVEGTIAEWAAMPGTVAIRIMMTPEISTDAADPGINRILAAAAKHDLPVNMLGREQRLQQIDQLAKRNPNTQIVLDHLGLEQPFEPPAPAEPWKELPHVLALAANKNIVIKITGACTLSHQKFPYKDIWDPLARIFDAFTLDRCLWGTDWTRAVNLLTYKEGVEAFRVTDRLSDSDRAKLMGGSLAKVYGWSPSK